MTTLAALGGFAAAMVVVLAWIVIGLRRDVRDLHAQLVELRAAPPPGPGPAASVPRVASDVDAVPTMPMSEPTPESEPTTIFHADVVDEPLDEVPVITRIAEPADDVDLTARRVASVTLARPLIKVAALSHGVRQALDDEHRLRLRLTMRRELKQQRKLRRRRRAGR